MTTDVLMVIDGSGSMAPYRQDVIGAFNTYVGDLRLDMEQQYRITAVVFNHDIKDICEDTVPAKVPALTPSSYAPMGSTALYHAVGTVITEYLGRNPDGGNQVLLVVNTDGQENASGAFLDRHRSPVWTKGKLARLMREREQAGWMTLYIGAGPDAWGQQHDLGMSHGVNTRSERIGETYTVLAATTSGLSRGMHTNTSLRAEVDRAVGETPDAA